MRLRCTTMIICALLTPAPSTVAQEEPSPFFRLTGQRARDCATCHLRWVESFRQPTALTLVDRPTEIVAAEESNCLGCHDGAVADDRRKVWREHSHQTGIRPPAGMAVPEKLPLKNGKIACRTCHTAHSGEGPQTLATTIFLRVPDESGQLCMLCHTDHTGGPAIGSHPMGRMPFPLPEALAEAGARAGRDRRNLACETCHTPHGSREEHLLILGTQSSQLCLRCHEQLRPDSWSTEALKHHHPINVPLRKAIRQRAVQQMGTKTGPGHRLICLSCHQMHRGHAGNHMLAETPAEGRLCLRCHPEQAAVLATSHNLQHSAPEETNQLGQTAAEAGPCSACHASHQDARVPHPTDADPSGRCLTCHIAGQCAENATFTKQSHPVHVSQAALPPRMPLKLADGRQTGKKKVVCETCHDPHTDRHGQFLVKPHDDLCGTCHTTIADSLAGAHDLTAHPEATNGRGKTVEQAGRCGFCHAVHDAFGPAMWAVTTDSPVRFGDLCVPCHRPGGVAADVPAHDLRHPAGPETAGHVKDPARWPTFDAGLHRDPKGFVGCGTCHDVHGDSSRLHDLLRTTDRNDTTGACLACHTSQKTVLTSLHAPMFLKAYQPSESIGSAPYCLPCHVVHAPPGSQVLGTWAAPLGPPGLPMDARKCLGCHGGPGPAPQVRITFHPEVPIRSIVSPHESAFLPLIDDAGRAGIEGRISCRTCHVPHGRAPSLGLPVIDPTKTNRREIESLDTMLRPYLVPNLCSSCHGFEGLTNFLYYHYPEKRRKVSRQPPLLPGSGPTR